MALDTFFKQPGDTQDYDVDFRDWLTGISDTGATKLVTADTGITLGVSTLLGGVVKVWLSGGTSGQQYKITVTLTTTGTRVKQWEFIVKVKEI